MRVAKFLEELFGGLGFTSLFIGLVGIGGSLDSEFSIVPALLLFVFGAILIALCIVVVGYEEWQHEEDERIRRTIARHDHVVHVSGSRR